MSRRDEIYAYLYLYNSLGAGPEVGKLRLLGRGRPTRACGRQSGEGTEARSRRNEMYALPSGILETGRVQSRCRPGRRWAEVGGGERGCN